MRSPVVSIGMYLFLTAHCGWSSEVGAASDQPFEYVVNDFTYYPTPDIPHPAWGEPYNDPIFNTKITRITDAEKYIGSGYPKWDIENADGTMLLLHKRYIYEANTHELLYNLPRNVWDTKDPDQHWSREDPEILYITYRHEFLKYNVVTSERTVLMDFTQQPELADAVGIMSRVYTMEEGDTSDDRRYWPLLVRCYDANHDPTWYNSHYLVLDKDAHGKDQPAIIHIIDQTHPNWRGAGMISASPSGNFVQTGAPPSYVFSRDFETVRRIETHGHVDFAVDDTGREVLVWVGSYGGPDGYSSSEYGYWVKMADIDTGETFVLAPFGDGGGFHVSGNSHNKPGWAVVSCYSNEDEGRWQTAQIMMYELTRRTGQRPSWDNHANVWRIAHTHMVRERYADDPFAKINLEGTKIWFQSGWGKSYNDDDSVINVFQIDLPETWYEDLSGFSILTYNLADGVLGQEYGQVLRAIGGTRSYQWTVAVGALPPGLILNPVSGTITGIPAMEGVFAFTVSLTDSGEPSETITRVLSITVIDPTAASEEPDDPPEEVTPDHPSEPPDDVDSCLVGSGVGCGNCQASGTHPGLAIVLTVLVTAWRRSARS